MARQPRYNLPGIPQHVIQRGNNRQAIFRAKADYEYYLEKLTTAAQDYQCAIHAYVLMGNHVHILVTPETDNSISKMMQVVGRYYVQHYNQKYNRTGTLWEGRYKATLIDSEHYLLTCMKYIELNPVRAKGMAKAPGLYRWSSYASNANGINNPLVTTHSVYNRLAKTEKTRRTEYKKLLRTTITEKTLTEIRDATNKAWVLGDSRFKKRIAKKLDRPVDSKGHGGDRKSNDFQAV